MFSKLNPRERLLVFVGGVLLLLVLIYFVLLMPYRQALNALDNQIASRTLQLQEVNRLRADYLALQEEVSQVERLLDRQRNFSALTFVENVVGRTAGRENLVSMRPQPTVTNNQFAFESVEVKLEKLALRQVLELLWAVENADLPVQIKNLYLKQRFDNRSQIDATMTIVALRRAA
ncbi:MAG: type II secretion system protein GspM [Desulfuromonadales bacterium]|jgi:general secretion pathway protein M